jgi:hypothetical protein
MSLLWLAQLLLQVLWCVYDGGQGTKRGSIIQRQVSEIVVFFSFSTRIAGTRATVNYMVDTVGRIFQISLNGTIVTQINTYYEPSSTLSWTSDTLPGGTHTIALTALDDGSLGSLGVGSVVALRSLGYV